MNDEETTGPPSPYQNPSAIEPATTGEDAIDTEPFKPLKTIWLRPRKTLRQILAVDPEHHVVFLACLAGIGEALDRASTRNLGDQIPAIKIFLFSIFIGPLAGMVSLWVGSFFIWLAGHFLGGTGTLTKIKTAVAWAMVPNVWSLLLWMPQFALFGSDLFTEEMPRLEAQPMLLIPYLSLLLVEMVLATWALVLICNTIAEAQGYRSAWRGLGNILLSALTFLVPIFLFILAISPIV